MKPFILGCIFARGGSKGVLRKNIRNINYKPLIAYAIEAGKAVKLIDRLIVSTDDDEIARVARQYGAEVPFIRPAELATDTAPELLAWKHALRTFMEQSGKRVDMLVTIPTTSPLRIPEDIEVCIKKLLESDADIVVTVTKAHRSPYFNMVVMDGDKAQLVISNNGVHQRQQSPAVYDMTTVAYAARVDYILQTKSILEGKVKAVIIPPERALDIDTPMDFEIAEFLMKRSAPK